MSADDTVYTVPANCINGRGLETAIEQAEQTDDGLHSIGCQSIEEYARWWLHQTDAEIEAELSTVRLNEREKADVRRHIEYYRMRDAPENRAINSGSFTREPERVASGDLTSRVWKIGQLAVHPETGKLLLTEERIKEALSHKSIKRWAYVLHDKDVYKEDDIPVAEGRAKAGDQKLSHYHIIAECEPALKLSVMAGWFGVEPQYVEKAKGRNAFVQCCEYLTHEHPSQQALGKHLYQDSEIRASFSFRDVLDIYHSKKQRDERTTLRDEIRRRVTFEGLSLRDVARDNPDIYVADMDYLKSCRSEYVNMFAKLPTTRVNIYIEGAGGIGKGTLSQMLARVLIDPDGKMSTDDIFFEVGGNGKVCFDGYGGQPVIIWNDCRAITLLNRLGGRENVFNVFDPIPGNMRQHIKYGSIRLINSINIINSIEPWKAFLDGLAGEYTDRDGVLHTAEDKAQSYRRFPLILTVREDDYRLLANVGCLDGTRDFGTYRLYDDIRMNTVMTRRMLQDNQSLRGEVENRSLSCVIGCYRDIVDRFSDRAFTDAEIDDALSDNGRLGKNGFLIVDHGLYGDRIRTVATETPVELTRGMIDVMFAEQALQREMLNEIEAEQRLVDAPVEIQRVVDDLSRAGLDCRLEAVTVPSDRG